jgi:hypothetical protein
MDEIPYSKGTIKLTWIDPSNYEILHSAMYQDVESALRNIPKGNENWMIFRLEETDGIHYSWKLLPYGQYKEYISGMKFRDNKVLYYGGLALMVYGAFSILKMFAK